MSADRPAYARPRPDITAESKPFWDGCARHELLLQRCTACGRRQHYPRGVCAACWSSDLVWERASGRATIYSFTVTYRTQARGFRDELPYLLAWVELEEGVQVMTNVVGVRDPEALRVGQAVRVVFEDVAPGLSLYKFTPA